MRKGVKMGHYQPLFQNMFSNINRMFQLIR